MFNKLVKDIIYTIGLYLDYSSYNKCKDILPYLKTDEFKKIYSSIHPEFNKIQKASQELSEIKESLENIYISKSERYYIFKKFLKKNDIINKTAVMGMGMYDSNIVFIALIDPKTTIITNYETNESKITPHQSSGIEKASYELSIIKGSLENANISRIKRYNIFQDYLKRNSIINSTAVIGLNDLNRNLVFISLIDPKTSIITNF